MKLPFGLSICKKVFHKDKHRKKMVAAFIEGGTIIIASNSKKTDPLALAMKYRQGHCHAEFNVLKNIKDGSKGTLYIYREKMDNTLGMAKPCEQCDILLREKNIKKIVYTTENGYCKEKILYP